MPDKKADIKGIIFDLDGTLVDSLEDLADSMNSVLIRLRHPVHDLNAYRSFIGDGVRELIRAALPESARDEPTVAESQRLMTETYDGNCLNKTRLYNGIVGLLGKLRESGIRLSVLSNKADAFTQKIVQALLPGYFELVLGLRTGAKRKPDPSGALEISEEMGIIPGNMMMVGDTPGDIQTAKNAGMISTGVLWGFRTRDELIDAGAEYLLNSPRELMDIL
jgi:phosphoglycolate phosphatase